MQILARLGMKDQRTMGNLVKQHTNRREYVVASECHVYGTALHRGFVLPRNRQIFWRMRLFLIYTEC